MRFNHRPLLRNAFVLVFSLLLPFALQAQARRAIAASVPLARSTAAFTVEFDADRQAYADYLVALMRRFLPAAETYLDSSFPRQEAFTVFFREAAYYDVPGQAFSGQRMSGVNLWDHVNLEYRETAPRHPGLLTHEFAHFWFGNRVAFGAQDTSWFLEGIASFLPFAMEAAGAWAMDETESYWFGRHYGNPNAQDASADVPLASDIRLRGWDANSGLFYSKTFYLQYYLSLELGPELYRALLRQLLVQRPVFASNDQIVAFLNTIKRADWRRLLTGWVFPGAYASTAYLDFADADSDGIRSAVERIVGTDPANPDTDGDAISDGDEVAAGTNPLAAFDATAALAFLLEHGPSIDGADSDWIQLPCYSSINEQSVPMTVFGRLNVLVREDALCFSLHPNWTPLKASNLIFGVYVDADGDGHDDYQFCFATSDATYVWRYLPSSDASEPFPGLAGGLNGVYEMRIPLSLLPSGDFRLRPFLWDQSINASAGEWNSWIPVDREAVLWLQENGLQSDLVRDDFDLDGMPDVAEYLAGFDPRSPDSSRSWRAFAPFVDGRDTEWAALAAPVATDSDPNRVAAGYDIRSASWFIRGDFLYTVIRPAGAFEAVETATFDLAVDLNGDNRFDREFLFRMNRPSSPWMYNAANNLSTNPAGLSCAIGDVVEFAVPLSLIGARSFRLYPSIFNSETTTTIDAMSEWMTVRF